jgi:short subunit dehydrogenase-like uncharacterized protein
MSSRSPDESRPRAGASPTFLIYGANGFTGTVIAERAHERGLRPVLAGRNRAAIEALGKRLGFPTRVFDLESSPGIRDGLRGVAAVLNCAGPFSVTCRKIVDACLATRVHYLDISGECATLTDVSSRDAEARAANVVLLPGTAFDVVPTDCLAKRLHEELPDATCLELAFSAGTRPSPGTMTTFLEMLRNWTCVREHGNWLALPRPRLREIPFEHGRRFGISVPWGDLVTAYQSTRIPNITVYAEVPRLVGRLIPLLRYVVPILSTTGFVRFLRWTVARCVSGPSREQRMTGRLRIWGRVTNPSGRSIQAHLEVPEGYAFSALAAIESIERVLRREVRPGATTPSLAFGREFVTTLPGVSDFRIDGSGDIPAP